MKSKGLFTFKWDGLHSTSLLLCLLLLWLCYNAGIPNILKWDLFGHYAYLPLLFKDGNLVSNNLAYLESINATYQNTPTMYQFVLLENGNYISKYTAGWSVLMSPFYFIADWWAAASTHPRDGFSFPYQMMMALGSSFYGCLGLCYLQRILRYFFELRVAILTLILITLGTNWLFMNYAAIGSSNNIEFFLVAWLLWLTIRFHDDGHWRYALALGVCIGLLGLVRPPDLLFAFLPVVWNCNEYGGFWAKIRHFLREKRAALVLIFLPALGLFSLQLIYWKMASGSLLMNSYANNAGEGFDLLAPYVLEVLFSFRK